MFNTFNVMAINCFCILRGQYYPTLPYLLKRKHSGLLCLYFNTIILFRYLLSLIRYCMKSRSILETNVCKQGDGRGGSRVGVLIDNFQSCESCAQV